MFQSIRNLRQTPSTELGAGNSIKGLKEGVWKLVRYVMSYLSLTIWMAFARFNSKNLEFPSDNCRSNQRQFSYGMIRPAIRSVQPTPVASLIEPKFFFMAICRPPIYRAPIYPPGRMRSSRMRADFTNSFKYATSSPESRRGW